MGLSVKAAWTATRVRLPPATRTERPQDKGIASRFRQKEIDRRRNEPGALFREYGSMSSPSEKPFDPFDLSPYAPKKTRERTALDQTEKKEDAAGVVLPYAPRAALPLEEAAAPAAAHRPVDLDAIDKASAAPPAGPPEEPAAAKPSESTAAPAVPVNEVDTDLERLEASLQWIQREGSRLPRAASLPPVSGLRAPGPEGSRSRGEQMINGIRVPPSLAPERLRPPPMREGRHNLRAPMRVLVASVIAAPIAYYFSV